MANLCIIPARGGSKRIPKKNVRAFLGKPIIAYAIETALQSGLFDKIMVSTDDPEIAAIAKQYGALVPFMRSNANANDFATTASVLTEVLDAYKQQGEVFNNICCLYPCTPLLDKGLLVAAYTLLMEGKRDTVFPVLRFGFPIQRALVLDSTQKLNFIQPEHALSRSQDLSPSYHDAGQFYWINAQSFSRSGILLTENTAGLVISELEAQDIDNETDWKMAEMKYQLKQEMREVSGSI